MERGAAGVAGVRLTLDLVGGDVWGWTKRVSGSCQCPLATPEVYIVANGADLRARRLKGHFRATVRLEHGANEVVAECRGCARGACRSRPIVLRRRLLRPRPSRPSKTAAPHLPVAVPPARAEAKGGPTWIDQAVVYGVVPHNFGPRGLRSVIERLDSLQDLGITALWLAPFTATPTPGSHGYAVTDYFRVRRDYGTKQDLRALVRAAHARGMRVLMDFVPNHSSRHHRYLNHVERYGQASPYYDYFLRRPDGAYSHYFHWSHLPNLNYDNPEVRQWMLEASLYWVRECDLDGFRVDAAWGVQQRRPDFWPRWRQELTRLKPDLLLLAEASARDPYWFASGFDAAYDWTEELGQWAWQEVFEDPTQIVTRLHAALTNEGQGYPPGARVFRFLNNNDTGKRFLTRYSRQIEQVAALLLLTLPGIPCLYTGQECGAEFEPYRTPGPISWEDPHGLRPYYQHLIALRRTLPALHARPWLPLELHSRGQAYGYLRGGADTAPALVLLNFSPTPARVEIALNQDLLPLAAAALTDQVSGEPFPLRRRGHTLQAPLAPYRGYVLTAAE